MNHHKYHIMNRKELVEQIFAKKSFLCVGLDTDINKLPKCITEDEDIQGAEAEMMFKFNQAIICLLYTSPSPRDRQKSRMPSSA